MEGTICMLFSCAGRPDRHCASSGFKVQDATARTLVRQAEVSVFEISQSSDFPV